MKEQFQPQWQPGPWRVNNLCEDPKHHTDVCSSDDFIIALCDPYLENNGNRSWGITKETVEANCRLIASAPELFASLDAIYENAPPELRALPLFQKARAALDKAIHGKVEHASGIWLKRLDQHHETINRWADEFQQQGLLVDRIECSQHQYDVLSLVPMGAWQDIQKVDAELMEKHGKRVTRITWEILIDNEWVKTRDFDPPQKRRGRWGSNLQVTRMLPLGIETD